MTAAHDDKEVIARWFSVFNSGDLAVFDDIHDPECRNHAPAPFDLSPWPAEGKPFGPADAAETVAWLRRSNPTLQVTIEHLLAEGDQVVAWIRATGTPTGDGPIPGAGRPVDFAQAHRFRLRDGKVVEHWAVRDDLRSMVQAGAITAPQGPPARGEVGS